MQISHLMSDRELRRLRGGSFAAGGRAVELRRDADPTVETISDMTSGSMVCHSNYKVIESFAFFELCRSYVATIESRAL
jgi:hypothetical protein